MLVFTLLQYALPLDELSIPSGATHFLVYSRRGELLGNVVAFEFSDAYAPEIDGSQKAIYFKDTNTAKNIISGSYTL
jgi:hypothetical protein